MAGRVSNWRIIAASRFALPRCLMCLAQLQLFSSLFGQIDIAHNETYLFQNTNQLLHVLKLRAPATRPGLRAHA